MNIGQFLNASASMDSDIRLDILVGNKDTTVSDMQVTNFFIDEDNGALVIQPDPAIKGCDSSLGDYRQQFAELEPTLLMVTKYNGHYLPLTLFSQNDNYVELFAILN